MNEITKVELPSGATLRITLAPFGAAKALYQALLREFKDVPVSSSLDVTQIVKNAICAGFSSPAIDAAMIPCLQRCTIDYGNGDLKIDDDTFQPAEARGDYVKVYVEVIKANVLPFGKSLYADFQNMMGILEKVPASK